MRKLKHCSIALLGALLLSATLLVTGCDGDNKTGETEAPTASATEAVTDPATEAETQPESDTETETETVPLIEESLNVGEPTMDAELAMTQIYSVMPTQKNGMQSVKVSDVKMTFTYKSTFYGMESAIDRDTTHYGHLFNNNLLTTTLKNLKGADGEFCEFVMGNVVGDRRDEFIMVDNGTLIIAAMNNKDIKYIAYTQSLGVDATVVGTGLFNGDLYTDIVLYTAGGQILMGYGSNGGFTWKLIGRLPDHPILTEGQRLYTGDVNGDGRVDLVLIDDITVTSYFIVSEKITHFATTTLPFAEEGQFLMYAVGDVNCDRVDDILCIMVDGTTEGGEEYHAVRTYFGRQDGHFGPYESEGNNGNLYATYRRDAAKENVFRYERIALGDVNGDGAADLVSVTMEISAKAARRNVNYATHIGDMSPAYDYSTHFIKTDDGYILYNGGMYETHDTEHYTPVACDHPLAYTSSDGMIWHQNLDGACIVIGNEVETFGEYNAGDIDPETGLRIPGTGDSFGANWWVLNTIEPEVVRDPKTGIYYMFTQTENYCYLEDGKTLSGADRIGVATSTDGIHFERKIDSPVIKTDDIYSTFTHHQVIYVEDDPDGKCWWMYLRYVHKNNDQRFEGAFERYIRIRSADPTCFDMTEEFDFLPTFKSQGNQLGYISNYDGNGNRLFIGIVTTDVNEHGAGHSVPTLIFSLDGVNWTSSSIYLAGVDMSNPDESPRGNMYFVGMSTIYGTGELYKNAKGEYEFIYGGCCSPSPIAPGIFYSEVGVGKMTFTLDDITVS